MDQVAGTDERMTQDVAAVTRARADAIRRVRELGRTDLTTDVALVVTELVTNAVLHGGGCSSVDISLAAAGVRVEVGDRSRVPPVVSHEAPDSLTGRGVRLVKAVAARWGAESRPDGKVVWAEVTGEAATEPALGADEILDLWDDPTDRTHDLLHVELGDVPTDLLLAAKSHVDSLVREFELASAGADAGLTAEVPAHLANALRSVVDRFSDARVAIKHQALQAARTESPSTRLTLDLPVAAADAGVEYLAALDEVDTYCRAKRLLTLETPPQHRIFRRWYVGELVEQLRAAAAGAPPPPPEPFERRLLAEIDRLADAQRASERAARLYTVAAALAKAAAAEDVAAAVLEEGTAALGATAGGVMLATEEEALAVPGAVGYDESVLERLRSESRDAELPAAVALRTGTPVWLESMAERDERFPELVGLEATTVSMCAVPLEVAGHVLGALRFSFSQARLFDDNERRFILALAAITAQALARVADPPQSP
jgi:anti-sigma regulatory factor (Ser/Thr protein kinase)